MSAAERARGALRGRAAEAGCFLLIVSSSSAAAFAACARVSCALRYRGVLLGRAGGCCFFIASAAALAAYTCELCSAFVRTAERGRGVLPARMASAAARSAFSLLTAARRAASAARSSASAARLLTSTPSAAALLFDTPSAAAASLFAAPSAAQSGSRVDLSKCVACCVPA